jgi:predicted small metal-binding protein
MAKVLKCDDVVPGCKTIFEGRDEVEVVAKEAEHVLVAHKMKRIPGVLLSVVRAAVADRVELSY